MNNQTRSLINTIIVGMLVATAFAPWVPVGKVQAAAWANWDYTVENVTTTYTWISAAGGVLLYGAMADENMDTFILPFNFRFYDTVYPAGTTIKVGSDGWMTFDGTATGGSDPDGSIPSSSSTYGAFIAICNHDLDTRESEVPGGYVAYIVTGTAPNRVLTIEYYHTHYYSRSTTDYIDVEVSLYESTNEIILAYKDATGTPFGSTAPAVGVNAGDGVHYTRISDAVGNGMSNVAYKLLPTNSLTSEVAVGGAKPSGLLPEGEHGLAVTLYNLGINPATQITVNIVIYNTQTWEEVHSASTVLDTLSEGSTLEISLGTVNLTQGLYRVNGSISFAGDTNLSNNWKNLSLNISTIHDMAVTSINYPPAVPAPGDIAVNVSVRNNGNVPENGINVSFYIPQAGAYILSEGFEDTSFPPAGWFRADVSGTNADWSRETAGQHPTSCMPYNGSAMARFNSFSASSGNSERLGFGPLDFTAQQAVGLELMMYHDTDYSSNDRLYI
ncbi:MAG: hypothetical protein QW728_06100, partial [Thermoplasmata archaeon]